MKIAITGTDDVVFSSIMLLTKHQKVLALDCGRLQMKNE
jgi:hypothetical protein